MCSEELSEERFLHSEAVRGLAEAANDEVEVLQGRVDGVSVDGRRVVVLDEELADLELRIQL